MTTASLRGSLEALSREGVAGVVIERPWALLLLLLIAFVVVRGLIRPPRRAMLWVSRGDALAALPKTLAHGLVSLARFAFFTGLVLLVLALSRPRVVGEPDPSRTEGIDIVVVLDVSGSMRAADFKPKDRLTVAKRVIAEHLFSRPRDRIGLVVFAGEAFTQAPLTLDRTLLSEILSGVRTGLITTGTAIGDALATGVNRLRDSKAHSKVIILVTDGDNNAGNLAPEKAAEFASEFDVKVFPILVGKGGRVPIPAGTDLFGQTRYTYVEWPTNPKLLKRIAKMTGGAYFSATDPERLAGSFQAILERMDRSLLKDGGVVRKKLDLYPWLSLLALALLGFAFVVTTTRGARIP